MDDANSIANQFGPMALPILFFLFPLGVYVAAGIEINIIFNQNPPLIGGWNPAILLIPLIALIEIYYSWVHYNRATKATWLTMRYWLGTSKRHFDNDFKLDHTEWLGKSLKRQVKVEKGDKVVVAEEEGFQTSQYGFVRKPKFLVETTSPSGKKITVDLAGDNLYEFHMRSKKFPVWLASLPDEPTRMLQADGNVGLVVDGGLMFEVEHIAAISVTRVDWTQTALVKFIPICVINDCAQIASDVALGREIVFGSKEGSTVIAKARDNFYENDVYRQLQDALKKIEIMEKQERNMEKTINARAATLAKADDKVRGGVIHPGSPAPTQKRNWVPWAILGGTIVGVLAILAIAARVG